MLFVLPLVILVYTVIDFDNILNRVIILKVKWKLKPFFVAWNKTNVNLN